MALQSPPRTLVEGLHPKGGGSFERSIRRLPQPAWTRHESGLSISSLPIDFIDERKLPPQIYCASTG